MFFDSLRFGILPPYKYGKKVDTGNRMITLPSAILITDSDCYAIGNGMDVSDNDILSAIQRFRREKDVPGQRLPRNVKNLYVSGYAGYNPEDIAKIRLYTSYVSGDFRYIAEDARDTFLESTPCKMEIGIGSKGWYYIDKNEKWYVPRRIKGKSKEDIIDFRIYEAVLFYTGILYPDESGYVNRICGSISTTRRIFSLGDLPGL